MSSKKRIFLNLHKQYILNTQPKVIVTNKTIVLCLLTNQVNKVLFKCNGLSKIYVNTKVLKHLYDKKPAEEYDFIINNLRLIVKYPDHVYKNKSEKRGKWCFVKIIKNEQYMCSLGNENGNFEVATAYRIRKDSYLKSYNLEWSWEGDIPPS